MIKLFFGIPLTKMLPFWHQTQSKHSKWKNCDNTEMNYEIFTWKYENI